MDRLTFSGSLNYLASKGNVPVVARFAGDQRNNDEIEIVGVEFEDGKVIVLLKGDE